MKRIFIIVFLLLYPVFASAKPIILKAIEEPIVIHGKKAMVFNIIQPDHTEGLTANKGDYFDVTLKNETSVPISIHWHGLILPNDQDGVPYVTQLPILPGQSHHYYFKLVQAGTYWMHSHYEFHEQTLMTAPLILKDKNDTLAKLNEIVVMFQGFSFKKPEAILSDLQHPPMSSMNMTMTSKPDLNDVNFDAYIANRHTLSDPEIKAVQPGETVRLRLINGATATNFWIDTGELKAEAIAMDGNTIHPVLGNRFQLAVAQRLDLLVTIPKKGGVFPILAQVEGTKQRTGIVLATASAVIPHFNEQAQAVALALDYHQEIQFHSLQPLLPRAVSVVLPYRLTGDMQRYIWKINDEVWPKIHPLSIKKGDRVEMIFKNDTDMAHPMHLHGHVFEITEIEGVKIANGLLHDTVLVLPHSTLKVVFDAYYPGIWVMHCHVLYHMMAGMMTTTNYQDYPEPPFYRELIKGSGLNMPVLAN